VDVTLRADRLVAQAALGVDYRAEEQHALLQQVAIGFAANIHGDAVDRIGTAAGGIEQAGPDGVQAAHFRNGMEEIRSILESKIR
jgi:hypothetical protein